jgi:glycerate kinase
MVEFLDAGLRHFAAITLQATGMDVLNLPGAGAAGGVGAALMAYLRGQMQSGVQVVLDTLQVDRLLPDCDLIITGEGRMDGQTTQGKAPVGIAQRGLVHGCRTIALVGSIAPGYEAVYERGIEAVFPIVNRPMTLAEAMEQAEELLQDTAARVTHALMRFWSP